MTDSTTDNDAPELPMTADGIDAQTAVNQIGLEDRCVFRISNCVFRYRGLILGEVSVDRLSEEAKRHPGRLSISDIWYDYHNSNLEIGEWKNEFVPHRDSEAADGGDSHDRDSEDEQISISGPTARTALMEVEIAIKHTGGPDVGANTACSPLALARQKVEASDTLGEKARSHVIDLLQEVSNERGMEISDADPLTDGTFQAQQELQATLEDGAQPHSESK